MAAVDMQKMMLTKSDHDPESYLGKIPSGVAGIKNIMIPKFRYQGKFTLNILPTISNPDAYINQGIDQLEALLSSVNSTKAEYQNTTQSLQSLLVELKSKLNALSATDKQKAAGYLQANIFADFQEITSFKQIKERPTTLFGLLIASAYAQDQEFGNEDAASPAQMRQAVIFMTRLLGAGLFIAGGFNLKTSPYLAIFSMAAGAVALIATASASQDVLDNIHNIDPDSLFLKVPRSILANQGASFTLKGRAIPLDSISPSSLLINQALTGKNNANLELDEINSGLSSVNSTLKLLSFSSQIEQLPLLYFPQTSFPVVLSPSFVTSVQIISSDDGTASMKPFSVSGNNLVITFNSSKTQNAKIRIHYVNTDMGITKDIDTIITIIADPPKAVISYTKNNLQVNFNSTGNTDLTGLTYSWDFGDTQTSEEKAPSHIYSQVGTYPVSLTVTDAYGGSSSVTENIFVEKAATGDAAVKLCMTNDDTSKYDFNLYAIDATPEGDALVESFSFNYTQSLNSDGYRINKCLCKTVNLQSNLEYGLSIKGISQELGDKIYPYAEYLVPENSTINFAVTYFVYPYRGYTHYIRDDSGWMCNE